MSRITHTCCRCSYKWKSMDSETERHVLTAMKTNKGGPYCTLCHYLEMARRHAEFRSVDICDHFKTFIRYKPPSA